MQFLTKRRAQAAILVAILAVGFMWLTGLFQTTQAPNFTSSDPKNPRQVRSFRLGINQRSQRLIFPSVIFSSVSRIYLVDEA